MKGYLRSFETQEDLIKDLHSTCTALLGRECEVTIKDGILNILVQKDGRSFICSVQVDVSLRIVDKEEFIDRFLLPMCTSFSRI
jgi:hypothetical protein